MAGHPDLLLHHSRGEAFVGGSSEPMGWTVCSVTRRLRESASIAVDMPERFLTAGQQYDLRALRRLLLDVGHHLEANVIGLDERVVKYQRDRCTVLQQEVRKRQPRQDRELLLRPTAKVDAALVDASA